jgi:hypothetical protein
MKLALATLASLFFASTSFAAIYNGVVGFRQASGTINVKQGGNSVLVKAEDMSCVMKFGPIIGVHRVVDGLGHIYTTGLKLAIQESCGELMSEAVLYMNAGKAPTLTKKYGRVGGYIFR